VELFLTLNNKKKNNDGFLLIEKSGNTNITYTFKTQDELFDYLKNNVPVNHNELAINIDDELQPNQKLLLKHSAEKAAQYQKLHGLNTEIFEKKKEAINILQNNELPIEEQSEKITELIIESNNKIARDGSAGAENENQGKKIEKVLLIVLAEATIDIYTKIFADVQGQADESKILSISNKVLKNLIDNLNLLIQNDYLYHIYKGNEIDIIKLRNNVSKVIMLKLKRQKELEKRKEIKK